MSQAKDDAEILLNAVLPFAEKMLSEHSEFYPYGAAMSPDGQIASVAGYDGRERPPSQDIVEPIRREFRKDARNGKYKATAIVYDVLVNVPGSPERIDAIAVAIDHLENHSTIVFFPYAVTDGAVEFGELFANRGDDSIFGP